MSEVVEAVQFLRERGIRLDTGLSQRDLKEVEREYGFVFADQHAELLRTAVPLGNGWPDWRRDPPVTLRSRLAWPADGVLFDVEQNQFWDGAWGDRPGDPEHARSAAAAALQEWPQLVPVYSHRFLLAADVGPVLSMYQTNVIVFGLDLLDYVHQEFGSRKHIDYPAGWGLPAALGPWASLI